MTTTQRIKEQLISYLTENSPSEALAIADANAREEIEFPCIVVDVQGSEAHSVALPMVNRAEAVITLRAHSGDEADASINEWIGSLERLFFDHVEMTRAMNESGVLFYEWVYNGSSQDWDAATVEITFAANIMFARI
jgi:hypothetical protein